MKIEFSDRQRELAKEMAIITQIINFAAMRRSVTVRGVQSALKKKGISVSEKRIHRTAARAAYEVEK